jgi:hypothetical protein
MAGGGGIGYPMSDGREWKKEKRSGQKYQRVNSRMQDIGRPRFGASAQWFSLPRAEPNATHNFFMVLTCLRSLISARNLKQQLFYGFELFTG